MDKPSKTIEILKSKSIDILLLDIIMPEVSGIDVLEKIRSEDEFKELQIVMLSALNDKSNFKKSFDLGANDYLCKPIDIIEFQSRVKAASNTRKYIMMMHKSYNNANEKNNILFNQNLSINTGPTLEANESLIDIYLNISEQIGILASLFKNTEPILNSLNEYLNFGILNLLHKYTVLLTLDLFVCIAVGYENIY